MMDKKDHRQKLENLAYELRRKLLIMCGTYGGIVHIGGDLSIADIFTVLFHHTLDIDPNDISLATRDRFVLSKGHSAVCMYIVMSMLGFFDYDEIVSTYGKVDSAYGMHPCKVHLPGVECSSGSLGQGLSMAVGMAFSAKFKNQNHKVYCMMGDGETCEGSVWEAAQTASSYNLNNLVAIIDRNRQLMTSHSEDIIKLEPYPQKWESFGWNVIVCDGHDISSLVEAFDKVDDISNSLPTVVICNTIKGKGVSFMEGDIGWHAGSLSEEDMNKALNELIRGKCE